MADLKTLIINTAGTHETGLHKGKPKVKEFCRRFRLDPVAVGAHLAGRRTPGLAAESLYREIRKSNALKASVRRVGRKLFWAERSIRLLRAE